MVVSLELGVSLERTIKVWPFDDKNPVALSFQLSSSAASSSSAMLFKSLFTLALAAVSIAAPAPVPAEVEDRAVSFESISIGLTIVITRYRSDPSFDNRVNLCRFRNRLNQNQRTNAQRLGFDFNRFQCPTVYNQLDTVQAGLGQAYEAWIRNPSRQNTRVFCAVYSQLRQRQLNRIAAFGININVQCPANINQRLDAIFPGLSTAYNNWVANPSPQNTAALCAITNQLTADQRSRIAALGITINVQCPSVASQLNAIQAGLGQAYQAYTRNQNRFTTNALCAITSQLTPAQQASVAALGVTFNVQCPTNAQRLDAISPGLSTAYNNLVAGPNVFANQLAYCQITTRLNFQQTAQLQALNLNGANGLQCTNVILRNRLNNISPGFGDAWYNWYTNRTPANLAALCTLTAQLSRQQRNRLLNLGVDTATFGCPA
ncbi:hypothetical protein CYLTODRAFT_454511 [Cylindrobasidium torrendii FP15055 ss-10]|uniref:Uncharacterized protein n=1 Tax=Cylindrobasidium torrendii FP15055 ss-10 TaxID=1314674 RepID=A0A0D7BA39_9AGAR|nr:hypothetical protein CYLTODRAFT_454511 [Cylindrobasidium torrendii FP15055 ss-10]